MMETTIIKTGIQALLPMVVLSAGAIILMMQIAFKRHAGLSWVITCLTLLLTALAIIPAADIAPQQITPILAADRYSLFFTLLTVMASLVTALLARDYLRHRAGENEEFYLLLLLATLGALVLVAATHLASFILGLELLGVALYALIAYPERGHLPLEAAIKYLVLSGAASAVLLFGFALIYAVLGTLSFAEIGRQLASGAADTNRLLIMAGTAMAFAGIGFKLSLVPFHMWTPDVYQGAPAPVTGFLATISKGAVFVALMRLFLSAELYHYAVLMAGLTVLAVASMLVGNLLALRQNNLKRLLAYSSIAHLGYLLITLVVCGVVGDGKLAVEAAGYYLVAYIVTTLAAFALVGLISSDEAGIRAKAADEEASSEQDDIRSVEGLFWRRPLLATLFTVALLSLAGIPLTVGFIGKFYIFTVGVEGALWLLLTALIIGSGIGIYYYLRVVYAMTRKDATVVGADLLAARTSRLGQTVVLALIFLMLWLGVNPQPLMAYLEGILGVV